MRIIELSEEEFRNRISTPFNPPTPDVSEAEFVKEYRALYEQLEEVLSLYGENDSYGQGDFCMEPAIARSRGLGLQVCRKDFITKPLLLTLQRLLISIAPSWEIFLGSDNYDYEVFIGVDAIRFHRNHSGLLTQLSC